MNESLSVQDLGSVDVQFTERGSGLPIVVLHGGAGPRSVEPWAELLARERPARVITPIHPGFQGTPRPEGLTTVRGLAKVYAAFLRRVASAGATVVGNSIGGWIAAELALLEPALVRNLVLVNAVGIEVPQHPIAEVSGLSLPQLAQLSYFDPLKFLVDPTRLTAEQQAVLAANRATLGLYARAMADPGLSSRLAAVRTRTLVVWGTADRIVDADYGRAFASAIPGAIFEPLARCGHLPQLEAPERLLESIWNFTSVSGS